MFHIPKEYKKKADFYKAMIVFATIILLIVLYLEKIGHFLAWIVSILFPFILGIGFAFILNILANAILRLMKTAFKVKETKKKRILANLLSILLVVGFLLTFLVMIIPRAFVSIQILLENLPNTVLQIRTILIEMTRHFPSLQSIILDYDFSNFSDSEWLATIGSASNIILGNNGFIEQVNSIITTTISWLTTLLIAFVFSIFILFNKNHFIKDIRNFFYAFLPDSAYRKGAHIYHIFKKTFTRYIAGSLLECIILGTLVIAGASILKIPYSILCGCIVAIGALVPMFGALLAAIVTALFLCIESPVNGVTFIIMFILIQQIEGNFIYPNVVGKSTGLPPMYVLVAITLGASLGGVLGIVIFIPLCSSIYQLLQEYEEMRIKKKNLY